MRTLVVLAALAALASAQFKPYNPISVDVNRPAPLNIPAAAPAPRPRPAPRPAQPAPRPPPPPPPPPPPAPAPVLVSTTAAPAGGAGGLFGDDGLGGARFGDGRGGGRGDGGAALLSRPPITQTGSLRSGSGTAEARNAQGGNWAILRQSNNADLNGYLWDIETENGIGAREQGALQNPGTQAEAMLAQGYYEYTGPDGVLYRVDYVADEGGFRAEGAHLPTPPPIPEAIQRALAYIAANPPREEGLRGAPGGRFARRK